MADWRSLGNRYWPWVLVLALGLAAGRATGGTAAVGTAAVVLAAVMTLLLMWRQEQRWRRSLRTLTEYIRAWQTRLESVGTPAETVPELNELRSALLETRAAILEFREGRTERLAGLQRDTLLLLSVLNTMVEAVVVLDGELRMQYVNPAARKLLELGERDVAGRMLEEVVRSSPLQDLVSDLLRSGGEQREELELAREDRVVTVYGGPLPLEPEPGVVLVLHDVTEVRRLEQMRREFTSNVSHELKTPLTSIQAYAEALLDGGLEDAAVNRGFVTSILQQSERLGRLIYDLLSLSRVETPTPFKELEPIALDEVLDEILPAHRSVAESRGLTLRVEHSGSTAVVLGEREGLRTICNNLIRNALSYTPRGGRVAVRVTRDEGEVQLEVQDTGVGIAREHHERIFERFYRVDKARSRDMGGTGLGLSIVKHLVTQFRGTVELESEVGQGSLFRVRWPVAAVNQSTHPLF